MRLCVRQDTRAVGTEARSRSRLQELIAEVERRGANAPGAGQSALVPTGWNNAIDADRSDERGPLYTLARGVVHEWFRVGGGDRGGSCGSGKSFPPLCLMVNLAKQALITRPGKAVAWIGRSCWPYAGVQGRFTGADDLAPGASATLQSRSIFVDPPDDATRLWATDLALRNPALTAVVADGSRLGMAASRRLQLAAQAGGVLALIARPEHEQHELSAASTRWTVQPELSELEHPRWIVELLRCKGVQPLTERTPRRIVVEWDHAKGLVIVPAKVVDRSGATARKTRRTA